MKNTSELHQKYLLSSLNNALKILEIMMTRDEITLNELTKLTGYNKTSVFKMLYTLEYRGFVKKTDKTHYQLGDKLNIYAEVAANRQKLIDLSEGVVIRLWANTQQSVILCSLSATGKMVIMSLKQSNTAGSVVGRIGAEMDWYTNSAGKILLSHQPKSMQEKIFRSTEFKKHSEKTIVDLDLIKKQLQEIKGNNVVSVQDENMLRHGDIAAPVFNHEGRCIASLGIVYEIDKSAQNEEYYKQQVRNAAFELSVKMGYVGELHS